jgi:hypothetical protein
MLVSGVVVDDRMDCLSLGNVCVDLIEEADELPMPMALHVPVAPLLRELDAGDGAGALRSQPREVACRGHRVCSISAGCSHLARRLSGPALKCMCECAHLMKAEQPRDLGHM